MTTNKLVAKLSEASDVQQHWYVYIVVCSDRTLYTGISNDVPARIIKHNNGKGAKYTKARLPVVLRAFWKYNSKSEAASAEYRIKSLSRVEKLNLIRNWQVKE